ncbi:hypothetical protein Sjap_010978 [Stephania japonica]|uniref:Uncharacterized protein n=1 Tax=Stephania japonica TaxID=461633 RepID=A0AAP0JAF1_9MAGN
MKIHHYCLVKGIKLDEYLLGMKAQPSQLLDISGTTNPDYEDWLSKNQMLISLLLNSLTPDITNQVIGYGSSVATWKAIAILCRVHNRAQIQLFCTSL